MIVWLNEALIDSHVARIDPADRGFTLGDGLFETMAVRGGVVMRLDAHLARLERGCAVLGLPYPSIDIGAAISSTLAANHFSDAAVRLTMTRGITSRDLLPPMKIEPTLLINVSSLPQSPPPVRCALVTVTRRNEYSPLAGIKSLNYLDNILARREASSQGAGEAILLNTKGRIAESCVANIFVIKNNKIFTPPVSDGALPGVMRADVLKICKAMEAPILIEDLAAADGIFLTNSLGIRPVVSIDGKPAPNTARAFIEDIRIKCAG